MEPVRNTENGAASRWLLPRLVLRGAILVIVVGLISCNAPHPEKDFWDIGAEYRLALLGTGPNGLLVDESGHPDSLVVALRVSSMDGDSIRGVYDGAFLRFGLRVGRATPGPQVFSGVAHGDSVFLRLTPDATDAGMLLEGKSVGSTIRGAWRTEAGAKNGSFVLTRLN